MTYKLFPAFSLSALLLACAHGPAQESTTANDQQAALAQPAARDRARADGEEGPRQATTDEPARADEVDVPHHRRRPELASTGDTLPEEKQPDNTAVNAEDTGMTPMDQGNSDSDVATTQRIRKAVMGSDVSFTAKNVKIITRDGHVVLRGPVNSQAEKDTVFQLATRNAGGGRVTNQLDVKSD